MTDSSSTFDYEKLVNDYEEGLFVNLRNFKPDADFLATWVPDEDTTESILNLAEAAQCAGKTNFTLNLEESTFGSLNMDKLTNEFQDTLQINHSQEGNKHLLTFLARS